MYKRALIPHWKLFDKSLSMYTHAHMQTHTILPVLFNNKSILWYIFKSCLLAFKAEKMDKYKSITLLGNNVHL